MTGNMGEVVAKKDNALQCFAQLKLGNGDRVLISIARGIVKVSKLGWLGLWASGYALGNAHGSRDGQSIFPARHCRRID